MTTQPVTVALVDDDAIVRTALGSYLRAAGGFEVVHECANGLDALTMITDRPVDVVIMDVRMPRLDGIQTTAELRRRFPDLKILVITSFDEDEAVRESLAAGANGFLLKDTSPDGLVDALRVGRGKLRWPQAVRPWRPRIWGSAPASWRCCSCCARPTATPRSRRCWWCRSRP